MIAAVSAQVVIVVTLQIVTWIVMVTVLVKL
jgi:hypothetical protein